MGLKQRNPIFLNQGQIILLRAVMMARFFIGSPPLSTYGKVT
jgi:hypothetical protein